MQHLTLDFDEFCQHSGADPEPVYKVQSAFTNDGAWIGGGAIRRTLIGQPLDSDFDFKSSNTKTELSGKHVGAEVLLNIKKLTWNCLLSKQNPTK